MDKQAASACVSCMSVASARAAKTGCSCPMKAELCMQIRLLCVTSCITVVKVFGASEKHSRMRIRHVSVSYLT